jgi:hypothetical protein
MAPRILLHLMALAISLCALIYSFSLKETAPLPAAAMLFTSATICLLSICGLWKELTR